MRRGVWHGVGYPETSVEQRNIDPFHRMRHAISTHLFANQRLSTALLDKILDAGLDLVELFCARQHLDYRNHDQIREVALFLKDVPMTVHSVHLPMYRDDCWGKTGPHAVIDIASPSKAKRIAAVDEGKRALELADVTEMESCNHD